MPSLCSEEIREPTTVTCMNASPIFRKMKVLRRIKKKIGFSCDYEGSRYPPLTFHEVCGDNVRVDNNGKIARRVESFCKGITFSSRIVKTGERVTLKLADVSNNWSGVIRFGFTSQNPSTLRDSLPKYACPDLTNRPGFWAKALNERYAIKGMVVSFYLNAAGDIHYSINGEERGVFLSGIPARCQLWVLVDIYGNSTAVEFLDPYEYLNNRAASKNNALSNSSNLRRTELPVDNSSCYLTPLPNPQPPGYECLPPNLSQLAIDSHLRTSALSRYPFHPVCGKNIILSSCQTIAKRRDGEYSCGYVFGSRPMRHGEKFTLRVLETEPGYVGALAFGLTSVSPDKLDIDRLPEDCDLLLDRPEYWVVSKDVASTPLAGEELTFSLSPNGEVTFARKNAPPQTIMHVDQTLFLWPFFDIYGNTKKVKLVGTTLTTIRGSGPVTGDSGLSLRREQEQQIERHQHSSSKPPSTPPSNPHSSERAASTLNQSCPTTTKRHSAGSPRGPQSTTASPASNNPKSPVSRRLSYNAAVYHECTVCYEKPVDCVLYSCGHMCMCYECAVRQWKFRCGGLCPICRAPIRDVIRTYRS